MQRVSFKRAIFFLLIFFIAFAVFRIFLNLPPELSSIPFLAFFSLYRIVIAYVLALIFSVIYGYYAGTNEKAARFLIPFLDLMQSIPILGFFPAAILLFINVLGASSLSVEMAAIFLIFTSMAWNMAFAVYESILSIPRELKSAVKSFGIKRFQEFRYLIFPACIPRLLHNSILSFSSGWYFLIASEIISLGSQKYKLPGIGSFLLETISKGDLNSSLIGLLTLAIIIIGIELVVWRPLSAWTEKFKYESLASERTKSYLYAYFKWSPYFRFIKNKMTEVMEHFFKDLETIYESLERLYYKNSLFHSFVYFSKSGIFYIFLLASLYLLFNFFSFATSIFSSEIPSEAYFIPFAIFASFLRIIAAFLIALAWTLPIAILISRIKLAERIIIPIFEVLTAIPAPAIFPFIVLVVISLTGNLEFGTLILLLSGMQWYLFFNIFSGLKTMPSDLTLAAKSFGVKEILYYKKILIPAVLPALVTGSITAFGGGWNALIVSEYVAYGNETYSVFGIGSLLNKAVYGNLETSVSIRLLFLSLLSMVVFILILNYFFWKPLYNYVIKKYRVEY